MTPFNEFFAPNGQPHPHQEMLAAYLRKCSPADVERLSRAVSTRVLEQEVTFNELGAPDGSERAWRLDEIPHIVERVEFDNLAAQLVGRARVLSACLDDIYGPRQLLREGLIPARIVLENPRYHRSLHGLVPIGGRRLIFYAADVIRDQSGKYVARSDRTAAPTGAGYALENRLAIGQVHAEAFREHRVRKVNRFFSAIGETLEGLQPTVGRPPRIVLLTPGQHDESSFEHGYLARYQGLDLVEGRDLTVRGDEVFLKTLEGLKKVDVILRRLSDDWCDPLELREDSVVGVPGLVGAARAGSVGIANPLGSGIIESPAFRAYLPQIAQALLGEELTLPSVPTRYLGDPSHVQEVMDTWADWGIRPAFSDRVARGEVNRELAPSPREALRKTVLENPGIYVAERNVQASSVPLGIGLSEQANFALRLFACWHENEFKVMPGGLGRANAATDGLFLPGDDAGTSKDVWVLGGKDAEKPAPPKMPDAPVEIRRGGVDLPSRLFDDIFWLGRYSERCDGSCRLIRQGLEPLVSENHEVPPEVEQGIQAALLSLRLTGVNATKTGSLQANLLGGIYDLKRPNSVRSCLGAIHGLTSATRSRLSTDTWNTLRRLTSGRSAPISQSPEEALDELEEILMKLSAYRGLVGSNMVRGHGWLFQEIGRRIERGVFVFTLIIHLFSTGESRALMETLLRACDSLLTYRSRYLSTLQATPVVDLVLTDNTNPQSVIFQVKRLLWCVRRLPKDSPFPLSRAEQGLIRLEASLVTADLPSACRSQAKGLCEMAEEGINLLWLVSDDLARSYFTHAEPSRSIAGGQTAALSLEADS